jgi:hypothetical protein
MITAITSSTNATATRIRFSPITEPTVRRSASGSRCISGRALGRHLDLIGAERLAQLVREHPVAFSAELRVVDPDLLAHELAVSGHAVPSNPALRRRTSRGSSHVVLLCSRKGGNAR